jgi:hypothetical protein
MRSHRKTQYIDGISEGLWKSCAIKAIRVGWLPGVEAASKRLTQAVMRNVALVQLFEDTLPAVQDIEDCLKAIEARDWDKYLRFDTHHGRGYSDAFADLKDEANSIAKTAPSEPMVKARNIYPSLPDLPPRALNVSYVWATIQPRRGGFRKLDMTRFRGIPESCCDSHTTEGYTKGYTWLSGTWENHRALGRLVREKGWKYVQERMAEEQVIGVKLIQEEVTP